MTKTVTYEPFTGHFTGTLSVFHSADRKRWIFQKPTPRIEKDQPYMLKFDSEKGTCSLLIVRPPDSMTGHAV